MPELVTIRKSVGCKPPINNRSRCEWVGRRSKNSTKTKSMIFPLQATKSVHWIPIRVERAGGVAITPQGQVRPCLLLPISCGNLQENSLREIWFDSQGLKDIRSIKYAHISECNVCPVRPYCVRCHAMAYLEQGKMRGPSLEACRHAVAVRDSLREAGKIAASETDMPPTWGRVRLDGQHHLTNATLGKRPSALRVI